MMQRGSQILGVFSCALLLNCTEQVQEEIPLARIVAEGATVEQLASGFEFTEGPAISPTGVLFFTDIRSGRIHTLEPNGAVTVFRTSQADVANGLAFDEQGRLYACEGESGRVTRTELDGSVTVLASEFEGNRFNSPNDLCVTADGTVYFTDPYFFILWFSPQPVTGVYRIAPDGKVSLVVSDLDRPNGIVQSADGSVLYVTNDNPSGVGEIWAFDIEADGSLGARSLFATGGAVMDGMTIDSEGNLYAASFNSSSSPAGRGVWVFDSRGGLDGLIPTPAQPANCTLSGDVLYITASQGVFSIRVNATDVESP